MDPPATTEHLADVLVDLTDTLGKDFDTAGLFHLLASAATQLLDVDAAAVLLLAEDGRFIPIAATDVPHRPARAPPGRDRCGPGTGVDPRTRVELP